MTVMRTKNSILLAKQESTYGLSANPTDGSDVVMASELTLTPIEADESDKSHTGDGIGTSKKMLIAKRVQIVFTIEIAGSGAVGVAPKYAHILKASGFRETVDSGEAVAYTPDINATESLTLAYNMDGNLHTLTGAKGTAVFNLNAREVPTVQFTFIGLFVSPKTTVALTGKNPFTNWKHGDAITKTNTPTALLDTQAVEFENLSIDMGDTLAYVNRTNNESVARRDRKSSGSCTIAALPIAIKNLWGKVEDETPVKLQLTHGVTVGNIIEFIAPKAQLTSPAYADNDGEAMQSFNLGLLPNLGSDEITITFK